MKKATSGKPGAYLEGTNTALVFTFRPDPSRHHRLPGVHFSFNADPTGAYVLIEFLDADAVGGTTYRTVGKHFVTKSGPGPLEFVCPYETPKNTGMRVTLAAGGSGIASAFELCGYELVGVT